MFDAIRKMYGCNTAFIDNQAPTADASVVAAKAGHRIWVDSFTISVGTAAATCFFEKGTSTKITPVFNIGINGNVTVYDPGIFTGINEALTFTSVGGSSTASVLVRYHYENATA